MIKIEWQQKPPKRGEKAGERELYPRLKDNGYIDFDTLCEKLGKKTQFSKGTYIGIFAILMEKVAEHLAEGKSVELDGLGTLRISVGTDVSVTASTRRRSGKVKVKDVSFIASDDLLEAIGQPKFECAADRATLFAPAVEQLKEPLLAYLAEHGSINRKEFMDVFRLKRSTSVVRLNDLIRMGVIKPKGGNRDRVYVATEKA